MLMKRDLMHTLDLRQVEVFYHVARLRSFSKAAEALMLTQPTISGHIKTLEDQVSLVLFDRLGREISLTRAGEVLYRYARRLLATKTAAVQALHELQGGMHGELVLGCSSIPGQYVLPALLGSFLRQYAEITVALHITDTMDTLDRIVQGELELGVVGAHVPHAQVVYEPFVEDELVLVVRRTHPWAKQGTVPLTALTTQPFIQRERGSGSRLVVEQILRQHGLEPTSLQVVAAMGSTEAIKQGIKAGIGVSIVSRLALTDEVLTGSLCTVALAGVTLQRHFYIVRHKGRTLSPLAHTFARFLQRIDPVTLMPRELSAHDQS